MQRIAEFSLVSYKQFAAACERDDAEKIYSAIKVPERATSGSAGYDFYAPYSVSVAPGESVKIATGIRARIGEGWVLQIFPRSGLGFKYRLMLNNTVGIIDSDYSKSDNEGHIFCKITNDGREGKTLDVGKGKGFCQGIFIPFGITENDDVNVERNGGFGSTDKK